MRSSLDQLLLEEPNEVQSGPAPTGGVWAGPVWTSSYWRSLRRSSLLLEDPEQVQADAAPLWVHIEDPYLLPLPGAQEQAAAPLVGGQPVRSDVALVYEAWFPHTDVHEGPEQGGVLHPARQHRAHLQVPHGHHPALKVCLLEPWKRTWTEEEEEEEGKREMGQRKGKEDDWWMVVRKE